jgi:hypothetical protein
VVWHFPLWDFAIAVVVATLLWRLGIGPRMQILFCMSGSVKAKAALPGVPAHGRCPRVSCRSQLGTHAA